MTGCLFFSILKGKVSYRKDYMRLIAYATALACLAAGGSLLYLWHMEQQHNRVLLEHIKREFDEQWQRAQHQQQSLSAMHQEENSVGSWTRVNAQAKDTVVHIISQVTSFNWIEPYKAPRQEIEAGTGFFVDADGHIVTNAHVVDEAQAISVYLPSMGKRPLGAHIVGVSPERDLALLRLHHQARERLSYICDGIPYLSLGDSDGIQRADEIMALGFPLGQQALKSTIGVVSGREHVDGRHMIQTSAAINPGNSGGPSLSRDGYVIGVNTQKTMETGIDNVGYIIPSNEVSLFLQQVRQMSSQDNVAFIQRPFLGVSYNSGNETLAQFLGNPQPGAPYITGVFHGSPLYHAGAQVGDMLYEVNGHALDPYGDIFAPWSEDKISIADYLGRLPPGEKIHLVLYRNGRRIETSATFTETELPPIRFRYPAYEHVPYEVIGGIVAMPLSLNHLPYFASRSPEMTKYMDLKYQLEPRVIVTYVLPDSQAYRTRALYAGAVIKEVNGRKVTTIEELRDAVLQGVDTGYVTLKLEGTDTFVALSLDEVIREEDRMSYMYHYQVTPFARNLQQAYERRKSHARKEKHAKKSKASRSQGSSGAS